LHRDTNKPANEPQRVQIITANVSNPQCGSTIYFGYDRASSRRQLGTIVARYLAFNGEPCPAIDVMTVAGRTAREISARRGRR